MQPTHSYSSLINTSLRQFKVDASTLPIAVVIEHVFYSWRVGMNPSKWDRWPDVEPVRLVLVRRQYRYEQPFQGLLLDDVQKSRHKWFGLVVFVDERAEGRPVVQRWFPGEVLTPIAVDPNIIDKDSI
ncbi:MAG: hypothetical protein H7288_07450 [Kineosporiaceae bacterium]|nr:hypothetical protein [Aeromicrobium sp.]